MELLTSIASEFNIPIIRKDQKVCFFGPRVEDSIMISLRMVL